MTIDLRSITPEQMSSIAQNVSAGLIVCQRCGEWTDKVYRVPSRYLGMDDYQFENESDLFGRLFGSKVSGVRRERHSGLNVEKHECAYCISRRAQIKKHIGKKKEFRIEKCASCGSEFEYKRRTYSEMIQAFGMSGKWHEEWSQRRWNESVLRNIVSYDDGFDCQYCDVCMSKFRDRRKLQAKERQRVSAQNSRTSKLGLKSDLTPEQWVTVLEQYDHKCAYCGGKFETMEHIVPVSFGGGTTKDNVVPACMPCNLKAYRRNIKNMMLPIVTEYRVKAEMTR